MLVGENVSGGVGGPAAAGRVSGHHFAAFTPWLVLVLGWAVTAALSAFHHERGSPVLLLVGGLGTVVLVAVLLTTRRSEQRALHASARVSEELARAEKHFRAIVASGRDLVSVTDENGVMKYVSPAITTLLGYAPEELLGRETSDITHPDDLPTVRHAIAVHIRGTGHLDPLVFRARHANGSWRFIEMTAANLLDEPAVRGIVFNSRDVTERHMAEQHLAVQATHDPLTGLPNRTLLFDRLEQALARSGRNDLTTAVLFVDLDRFKFVNDSLGHRAGDDLLRHVTERVRHAVRPGDTVARFGGDEFVVVAENVSGADECRAIAQRLADALMSPFTIAGQEVFVTASVGMTLADPATDTADTLLRDADAAMYRAKELGRARSEFFDEEVRRVSVDRLEIENALHRALERDELVVQYQPQVDLANGRVIGVEALLAWRHPQRGMLASDEFIGLAEESGQIVPIGTWVLREACKQGYRWLQRRGPHGTFRVSVNVSARQLDDPALVEVVARALAESGLPGDALCIEISEGLLTTHGGSAADTLRSLHRLGVRIGIDDFGTGYASLSHLKKLPVDHLKIDGGFVSGLGRDPDDTVIVAAVIGLAHALGVTALAEGVEWTAQLHELRALRCDAAQGYVFARPGSPDEVDEVLEAVLCPLPR